MKPNFYRVFAVALSVLFGATLATALASAATTISTNIQTDGTLSVTGATTLGTPLGVGSGGTGRASIASGYIPFGNGSSAVATSSSLFWDSVDGYLGIGPAAPTTVLEISQDGAGSYFANTTYRSSTFAGGLIFGHARGTAASPSFLNDGDRIASLFFKSYDSTGGNDPSAQNSNAASIEVFSDGASSPTATPGLLRISTTPAGSALAQERMRITSTGTVGIGISSPTASLEVATSSSNATTTVAIGKSGQNKGSCLVMYDVTGAVQYIAVQGGALVVSSVSCR